MWIHGVGGHYLAGSIHHGNLHPGAQPRIQAQCGPVPGGCGEQDVAQVRSEDPHCLGFRLREQPDAQVHGQLRQDPPPGLLHGGQQPRIGGPPVVRYTQAGGHCALIPGTGCGQGLGIRRIALAQSKLQDPFLFTPQQRQDPVGRHAGGRLREVEVVGELAPFGFLARADLRAHPALPPELFTLLRKQVRVLRHPLHQDGAGAGERLTGIWNLGAHIGLGRRFRAEPRIGEQRVGKRFQPCFAGNLRLGPALAAVGQVNVLQPGLGFRADDGGAQRRGQLPLRINRLQDDPAPVLQLTQIAQAFVQLPKLGVIKGAGGLLAVPGDKGNGGAAVEQLHRGPHLPGRYPQLGGQLGDDLFFGSGSGNIRGGLYGA